MVERKRGSGRYSWIGRNALVAWLKDTPEGVEIIREATRDHITGREWIETTPEGRALAEELVARSQAANPRPAVVVIVGDDGLVEVWGSREEVNVKVVNGPGWSISTSPEQYTADREEMIEALPLYHKDVMRRTKLIAQGIPNLSPRHGSLLMRVRDALKWIRTYAKHTPKTETGARPDETLQASTQDTAQGQNPIAPPEPVDPKQGPVWW